MVSFCTSHCLLTARGKSDWGQKGATSLPKKGISVSEYNLKQPADVGGGGCSDGGLVVPQDVIWAVHHTHVAPHIWITLALAVNFSCRAAFSATRRIGHLRLRLLLTGGFFLEVPSLYSRHHPPPRVSFILPMQLEWLGPLCIYHVVFSEELSLVALSQQPTLIGYMCSEFCLWCWARWPLFFCTQVVGFHCIALVPFSP